jgi:hypothetical protein
MDPKAGRAPSRQQRTAPRCRVPAARMLLLPYALSQCREAEALRFEAHLLACETCFSDLKTLDRAGALIREFADEKDPVLERVRAALAPTRLPGRRTPKPRAHST